MALSGVACVLSLRIVFSTWVVPLQGVVSRHACPSLPPRHVPDACMRAADACVSVNMAPPTPNTKGIGKVYSFMFHPSPVSSGTRFCAVLVSPLSFKTLKPKKTLETLDTSEISSLWWGLGFGLGSKPKP